MSTKIPSSPKNVGLRLQKIIAEAGLCSRRQAETWISDGEVRVNGRVATLGQKADPSIDAIVVRGKLLQVRPIARDDPRVVYLLNKPKGYICSHGDPHH
ncbi:MAG: S4 domain-containing protein, partial [Opitutales bacterium]|nr:S4 domain-containing protein [Opitutales bacterium]